MTTLLSKRTLKAKYYQTDQQVKYLHLEAEVDLLLQKLTSLMQRKETTSIISNLTEPRSTLTVDLES